MKNNLNISVIILIIGVILILTGFILGIHELAKKDGYESGYKAACADFYQGHLKYDLITNPDGTREWKKVKTED